MGKQVAVGVVLVIGLLFCAEASSFIGSSTEMKRFDNLKADFCPTCVSFSDQAINTLLNIILNTGIAGGCNEVCNLLANKTGSSTLGQLCDFFCDIVGFEVFSNLIEKADLDSIYLCELLKVCPINDDGDAKIANLTVTPMKGPAGTTFSVNVMYSSMNGTGTGEIYVAVKTVDGIPIASSFLREATSSGMNFESQIKVKASPDPSCDPSQQPCENWLPGNYTVTVAVCNGECGSKHPHSQVYDEEKTMFMVTDN